MSIKKEKPKSNKNREKKLPKMIDIKFKPKIKQTKYDLGAIYY